MTRAESVGQQSGGGILPVSNDEVWSRFRPRLNFYHQAGETIGLSRSLTNLSAFVPFSGSSSNWLVFADVSGQFIDDGAIGGSTGIGSRFYIESADTTFGTYLYYDYRDTGFNEFQQLSPGIELLGGAWEARANAYLTMAQSRKPVPNAFRGNFLFIDRFESALAGFDAEAGATVPVLGRFEPRILAGIYHLQAPARDHVWGWKGRVEATASETLSFNLAVRNDRLFETTVSFGVDVRFTGGDLLKRNPLAGLRNALTARPGHRSAARRLAESTHRLPTIAIDQSEETLAVDPATGMPLMFLHVAAGGNSDGSFESPYATIGEALADPRYSSGTIDVLYVHRSALQNVTHSGNISLIAGTSLLSNGPVQKIRTQSGEVTLPFSGINTALTSLPVIAGQITIGDNVTVSGFRIDVPQTAGAAGIAGMGLSSFRITNNVINVTEIPMSDPFGLTPFANGIALSGVDGTGVLVNNQIIGHPLMSNSTIGEASGVLISNSTRVDVSPTGNTIQGFDRGFLVKDSAFNGRFVDDLFQGNNSGIRFEVGSANAVTAEVRGTRFAANGTGIDVTSSTGIPTVELLVENNTFDNNSEPFAASEVNLTATFRNNQIEGRFAGSFPAGAELSRLFRIENQKLVFTKPTGEFTPNGIFVNGSVSGGMGPVSIDLTVENNSMDRQLAPAVDVLYGANDTVRLRVAGNTIRRSALGIRVTPANAGNVLASGSFEIEDNRITESGAGILLDLTGDPALSIRNNVASSNATAGILINGGRLQGEITGNTTSLNGLNAVPELTASMDADVIGGMLLFASDISATLRNNTSDGNGEVGFDLLGVLGLDSVFDGNTARNNNGPGLAASFGMPLGLPSAPGSLSVTGNTFSGNAAATDTEVQIENSGMDPLNLFLSGNTSTNMVPAGRFNFDITTLGGPVNITPAGVNAANTGTVGSSDGSVAIP